MKFKKKAKGKNISKVFFNYYYSPVVSQKLCWVNNHPKDYREQTTKKKTLFFFRHPLYI